jgi:hypothetical protein
VVLNGNGTEKTLALGRFKDNLGKFRSGVSVPANTDIDLKSDIKLAPMSALILELR